LKEEIEIIPQNMITPFIEKVEKVSPDPKDTVYLACALAINSKIWSNDKKLKEGQEEIQVITTEELINEVGFIIKENS
jgi:predicted nucleic acid-binding protein